MMIIKKLLFSRDMTSVYPAVNYSATLVDCDYIVQQKVEIGTWEDRSFKSNQSKSNLFAQIHHINIGSSLGLGYPHAEADSYPMIPNSTEKTRGV